METIKKTTWCTNKGLRKRFVSDNNLPIQVLSDPYFMYYLSLYDSTFGTIEKWNKLLTTVEDKFNSNPEEWLSHYAAFRDDIIGTLENNVAYKDFCGIEGNEFGLKYPIPSLGVGDMDVYIETNDNKTLLSIDLRKANFQALKFHNTEILLGAVNYEELIYMFTDDPNIINSKYTRQVIFGKLNPKRTTAIEKYIMGKIYQSIITNIVYDGGMVEGKCISVKTDEIIFEVTNCNSDPLFIPKAIEDFIFDELGFEIRAELFRLNLIKFETESGEGISVYEKSFIDGRNVELKKAPHTFYPQIYKICKGRPIKEQDRVFLHENTLAKFLSPLELEKNNLYNPSVLDKDGFKNSLYKINGISRYMLYCLKGEEVNVDTPYSYTYSEICKVFPFDHLPSIIECLGCELGYSFLIYDVITKEFVETI